MIVAEGGNDGLASALTIALAKGFLRYESSDNSDIERSSTAWSRLWAPTCAARPAAPASRSSCSTRSGAFSKWPAAGPTRVYSSCRPDHAVAEFVPKPRDAGTNVESDRLR